LKNHALFTGLLSNAYVVISGSVDLRAGWFMAFDHRPAVGERVLVGPMTESVRQGCGRKILRPQQFSNVLACREVKGSLRRAPLHFARP
jgi:hypothetical protein